MDAAQDIVTAQFFLKKANCGQMEQGMYWDLTMNDDIQTIYRWVVKYGRPIRSNLPKGFIIGGGKWNGVWSDMDQCWVRELYVPWISGYE